MRRAGVLGQSIATWFPIEKTYGRRSVRLPGGTAQASAVDKLG
jgi:hypothetical protein